MSEITSSALTCLSVSSLFLYVCPFDSLYLVYLAWNLCSWLLLYLSFNSRLSVYLSVHLKRCSGFISCWRPLVCLSIHTSECIRLPITISSLLSVCLPWLQPVHLVRHRLSAAGLCLCLCPSIYVCSHPSVSLSSVCPLSTAFRLHLVWSRVSEAGLCVLARGLFPLIRHKAPQIKKTRARDAKLKYSLFGRSTRRY